MTTADDELLLDDSPHTQAKHRLYRYYLDAWLPILIRGNFPSVRIVDGFAGSGRYKSGRIGSPQIAIEAILESANLQPLLTGRRRVLLQFIEQNPRRADHLKSELKELHEMPIFRSEVKEGDFYTVWSSELDSIEAAGGRLEPTLLFIDGFGYAGFPLELLARAQRYRSCEVLINFAWQSISQWAINDPSKHNALDQLFGGSRWRPGINIVDPWNREQFFLSEYQQALVDVGWRGTSFRMLNQNNQTSYHLVFGTTKPEGMEAFKTAAWRVTPDGLFQFADLRNGAPTGFLRDMTEDMVIDDLKQILKTAFGGQRVERAQVKTLGEWHPVARSPHVTAALTRLQGEGAIREVTPKPKRLGTFPQGSTIHFA